MGSTKESLETYFLYVTNEQGVDNKGIRNLFIRRTRLYFPWGKLVYVRFHSLEQEVIYGMVLWQFITSVFV